MSPYPIRQAPQSDGNHFAECYLYRFHRYSIDEKDKETSLEVFGPYIHRYKFDEAVRDKVVLDLRYEAREVEQNVVQQDRIDAWFEAKTRGLTGVAKAKLKQRWGNLQKMFSSKARLGQIVADIVLIWRQNRACTMGGVMPCW